MPAGYLKPGFLVSKVANPLLKLTGAVPTLAVKGRTSGRWRTVPVNVLEFEGARYLLAPRGDTQWARNLRATPEGELRQRGKKEKFRAFELSDVEKPPLIQAYLAKWGAQVKTQFEQLPEPSQHPVFRLEFR
jgi:deazaflavin-dependent oxidoreductase (nitroreductase family)